ncbi:MAG TPA: DUF2752 domain-containing protein [Terriglobales bacterium]|nr:DUF2752 domain-containing protein [Terriglobales bacterium]
MAVQVAGVLAVACLAVLYRFPPETFGFYPACPIYTWLHVECLGCGSTRALGALLHLQVREAVAFNPLFPGVSLAASLWAVTQYVSATWRNKFVRVEASAASYWAASSVALVFGIVRNLS